MESIGSFEAKTHLPALLERAARGETIIITRHGKPVARLVPPDEKAAQLSVEDSVAGLLEFRASHKLENVTPSQLVKEGRKH